MSGDESVVDRDKVGLLVDQLVTMHVPADQMVDRKIRPESLHSWPEPRPLAGLKAALAVIRVAENKAYEFARKLRGEGTSWREIADLLAIPWSEEYSRHERAFELVSGYTTEHRRGAFAELRVYWTCGGPDGCGQHISDRGPYDSYPADNETGHDPGCRRLAAEIAAYERESADREERSRIMDAAMSHVDGSSFSRETVQRALYVQNHGGRYQPWSTSETLAVALVLEDHEQLNAQGYTTPAAALQRVMQGWAEPPEDPDIWVRILRAAVTGRWDNPDGGTVICPMCREALDFTDPDGS